MNPYQSLPTKVSGALLELRATDQEFHSFDPRRPAPTPSLELAAYLKIRAILLLSIILRNGTTSESFKYADDDSKTYNPDKERAQAIMMAGDLIRICEIAGA